MSNNNSWWSTLGKGTKIIIILLGAWAVLVVIGLMKSRDYEPAVHVAHSRPAPPPPMPGNQSIEIITNSDKPDGVGNRYAYVRIKNNSGQLASFVGLTVTYYGENGTIVGTGMGNTASLASGSERTVTCIALNIEGAKRYEVQVDQTMYQ